MKFLATLAGLVLVLEGLPYAACPEAMRSWLRQMADMPPRILRAVGLAAVAMGLLLCFLARKTRFFG